MKKIAIVSCKKWSNKLFEDINLQKQLSKMNIDSDIISWDDETQDIKLYDALIIRSIWGYQHNFEKFKQWLRKIKNSNIKIYNSLELIKNNIFKDLQFEILKKNSIPYIETYFANTLSEVLLILTQHFKNKNAIIKPSISGSGDNTFFISSSIINSKSMDDIGLNKKIANVLNTNKECKAMIQPFVPEITNGEYSCVFIDGTLTHTMLRFPGVFQDKKRPFLVEQPPIEIINLARKVESILSFKSYLYMRVDMILINGSAYVMEVELTDPDLLTKYISNLDIQDNILYLFANKINERI